MQKFISEGKTVTWTNGTSADVASGQPVFIGNMICIALGKILDGAVGEVMRGGVVRLTKDAPLVITQGDELFWSTTNSEVTKTVTDKYIGTAFASEVSAATTVDVILAYNNGATVIAAEATADGSDAATTQALANALKSKLNAVIAALKAAGLMAGA